MGLAPYQQLAVKCFMRALPSSPGRILELGSDLEAVVIQALANLTGAEVVGINPSPEFPKLSGSQPLPKRVHLLREDGRKIPLPDGSVDGVFTVATVEHVLGIDQFYSEIHRVLKPGGILHADFAPIWSASNGHHTYAAAGGKEARYWKPGRNPVPDFAHLLWSPEELRQFLNEGPCHNALIEPIVNWIYHEDGINRVFLEEHLRALENSGLLFERLRLKQGVCPDAATAELLRVKYGSSRRFDIAGVEATMRKCHGRLNRLGTNLSYVRNCALLHCGDFARSFGPVLRRYPKLRKLLDRRHRPRE